MIVSHLIRSVCYVEGNTSQKHNVTFFVIMFHGCRCYAVLSVSCSLVIKCRERADLLFFVGCALLCFYYFLVWFPESGVLHDGIESWSLTSSLL